MSPVLASKYPLNDERLAVETSSSSTDEGLRSGEQRSVEVEDNCKSGSGTTRRLIGNE